MGSKTSVAERCAAASREIEETRGRISAVAGDLKNQLKPKALLRPVQRRLRGTLGEGGEKILDTFRDHPLPLTLTGIGIAWLIFRDLRGGREDVGDGGGGLEKVKETAGEAVEKGREAAHQVRRAAAAVPRKVREGVRKTSDWFSTLLEENPLVLAVATVAAGMAAGLSFPATATTAGKVGAPADEAALEEGTEALEIVEEIPAPQEPKAVGLPPGSQSAE